MDKNYADFEDKDDFDSIVACTCVNAEVLLVCMDGTMCRPEDVVEETDEEAAKRTAESLARAQAKFKAVLAKKKANREAKKALRTRS